MGLWRICRLQVTPSIFEYANPVGSPFAALRLRTDAAKRYKKMENATAVI